MHTSCKTVSTLLNTVLRGQSLGSLISALGKYHQWIWRTIDFGSSNLIDWPTDQEERSLMRSNFIQSILGCILINTFQISTLTASQRPTYHTSSSWPWPWNDYTNNTNLNKFSVIKRQIIPPFHSYSLESQVLSDGERLVIRPLQLQNVGQHLRKFLLHLVEILSVN